MKSEDIVLRYNAVIRGILGYYNSVENRNQFSYILWILKFSAVFTLARKLNLTPKQVWKKYGNPITVHYTDGEKETKRSIKLCQPNTLSRDRTLKLPLGRPVQPFPLMNPPLYESFVSVGMNPKETAKGGAKVGF